MCDLQKIVNHLVLFGRRRYYKESETRMNRDRVGVVLEAGDKVKIFLTPDFCYLASDIETSHHPLW
jgi:hypothetical protein